MKRTRHTQTVLVTGASSGLGKEIARTLCSEGYVVYGAARSLNQMADLAQLGVLTIKMDITSDEDIVAAVNQVTAERGGVDILINNAGFGMYGAMEDTTLDDARYQFEVNMFGLARLTQLVLPYMREQRAGRIVNVSSMAGKIYTPLGSWYHATKHALEGWSDCLRIELASFGIKVIIIQPGVIETGFSEIMVGPMLDRSGSGAYSTMANRMARTTLSTYKTGNASSPSVVAETVSKALRARRPRTRYAVGKHAKPLMILRKFAGDRLFDMAVLRFM